MKNLIIGITGASGSIYAKTLLDFFATQKDYFIHIIITENGKRVFHFETGCDFDRFFQEISKNNCFALHQNDDLFAPVASGSFKTEGMIVVPCSMATVAKIAHGTCDTLLSRAADVCIKERRTLVITPREMPFSTIHLKNMLALSECGAVICPPIPSFYSRQNATDMDSHIKSFIGRLLTFFEIETDLYTQWKG